MDIITDIEKVNICRMKMHFYMQSYVQFFVLVRYLQFLKLVLDGETKTVTVNMADLGLTVADIVPFDMATGVSVDSRITVTFSVPVDPATVDADSFVVYQSLFPNLQSPIPGHISLSSQNKVAVFIPEAALKADTFYHVKLTADIKDASGNALVPFESVFTTSDVLGNDALPPGALKASMPDADGYVTVRGGVGLTYGGAVVVIINKTKNIVLTVISENDGSFSGKLRADITDEIIIQVPDLLGNITSLSPGLFQNDDGTAAVGSNGGTIYGPGGIKAMVPEGAFDDTIMVQVTMLPEDAIKDVKINSELKAIGILRIDTGGVKANKEIKVTITAPEWITSDHQALLTKVVNIRGFDELTLTCPAILKDGQLMSTSPPFPGIYGDGTYGFMTWIDKAKGVAYTMVETWSTDNFMIMGSYDFVFPVPAYELYRFPVTIPVNQLYDINLSTLDNTPLQTVSVQGPPARGDFAEGVVYLKYDNIPPTVFTSSIPDGGQGILLIDNIVIEMSEQVDPATINCNPACGTVTVTDSSGKVVVGTVYLAADGKTIVFVPKYGYKYGETYKISINGVKDLGGNDITGYTSSFSTFGPKVLSTIAIQNAKALDKYKDNLVVLGGYGAESSGVVTVDVSDPENPQVKGVAHTFGFDFAIKALPEANFQDRNGEYITGDFAVAIGGQASQIGYLNFMNVSDPANPYLSEYVYLSWNEGYTETAPANVPFQGGRPYDLTLLGTNAYVANVGLGLQAVDLTKVTPPQYEAQRDAIGGTIAEPSYRAMSKVRNNVLAIKNHTLSIIDPQLNIISEVTILNYPSSVTGVEAFPIDLDNDGNIGEFEDNDGDAYTSTDETFDLALVSTSDGIVIINLNELTNPQVMAMIPMSSPGKIVANRAKRLAYTSVGNDLYAISLRNPSGIGLIDSDGDGQDDRIVAKLAGYGFNDAVLDTDNLGRELLYLAKPSEGVWVVDLNQGELELEISVSYDGGQTYATLDNLDTTKKKIYIKNNYNNNENPEMPAIKAIAKIKGATQTGSGSILLTKAINWKVKLDYQVQIPEEKSRSRGFDKDTKDGLLIEQSMFSGAMPLVLKKDTFFGNFLGGGSLKITAECPDLKNADRSFSGEFGSYIEGQTIIPKPSIVKIVQPWEDPYYRDAIIKYLESPMPDNGLAAIRSATEPFSGNKTMSIARVIAYRESRYSNFQRLSDIDPIYNFAWTALANIVGYPKDVAYPYLNKKGTCSKPSSDGGFGIMQLTNGPKPSYEQIWNWKKNVDGGIAEITAYFNRAVDYPGLVRSSGCTKPPVNNPDGSIKYYRCKPQQPPDSQATDFGVNELRMDIYSLYNSDWHYWIWGVIDKKRGISGWQPRQHKGKAPTNTGSYYADEVEKIENKPPVDF